MPERDRPTPAQVRELAMIGASSALERKTLRRRRMFMEGDFYAVERTQNLVESDSEESYALRHTVGMLLGRAVVRGVLSDDSWRLIYSEGYRAENGSRTNTVHTFEWTKDSVHTATRHSFMIDRLGDTRAVLPLDDVAPELSVRDDQDSIGFLAIEDDYTQVTSGDCELLADSLQRFYSSLRNDVSR